MESSKSAMSSHRRIRINNNSSSTQRLNAQDLDGIHSTMEHLIAVGSKIRHDGERRKEFQQHDHEWKLLQEYEEEESYSDPVENSDPVRLFAEDVRIYGQMGHRNRCVPHPPWPPKPPSKKRTHRQANANNSATSNTTAISITSAIDNDRSWDLEHGDSIHPLAFYNTKLSASTYNDDNRNAANNENYVRLAKTDVTLSTSEVPRALVLRCWERAVHAASSSLLVPVTPNIAATKKSSSNGSTQDEKDGRLNHQDPESSNININITESPPTATAHVPIHPSSVSVKDDKLEIIAKCETLGLNLAKFKCKGNTCPVCTRSFPKYNQLKQHFYNGDCTGAGDSSKKGCCWLRIPKHQCSLTRQILNRHVENQADLLLGLVLDKAKGKIPDNASTTPTTLNNKKRRRLLNWYDVLRFCEDAMAYASETAEPSQRQSLNPRDAEKSDALRETILTKPNACPLVLNPTILRTVRQRLIDRYADLPP